MRLRCMYCGKSVSTEVPDQTVVRASLECPECIEKNGLHENATLKVELQQANALREIRDGQLEELKKRVEEIETLQAATLEELQKMTAGYKRLVEAVEKHKTDMRMGAYAPIDTELYAVLDEVNQSTTPTPEHDHDSHED